MTPVGDIEVELAFRVAVWGRARDLAELMRMLEDAQAVILLTVKEGSTVNEGRNKGLTVSIGSVQP